MAKHPDHRLIWTDLETTGLNPWTTQEKLIQVATIITDTDLNVVAEPFMRVVRYDEEQARQMRSEANEYVRNMHDSSGLWSMLPSGTDLGQIDAELLDYVKAQAPQAKTARMVGNSIRLDLNFSEAYLPKTYDHLHYRFVDVSGFAYMLEEWGLVPGYFRKKKNHEALSDINESLAELRWLRSHIDPKLAPIMADFDLD